MDPTRFRTWLFRLEMRVRSRLGLDCAGCIQRELNRVGTARIPPGTFRVGQKVRMRLYGKITGDHTADRDRTP